MIPALSDLFQEIHFIQRSAQDYRLYMNSKVISGTAQGIEAIIQSIYKRLYTQRYAHAIYSSDYGMERNDLYGMPLDYVQTVLPGRIKETLLQDSRIQDVTEFSFFHNGTNLTVSFVVQTSVGEINAEYKVGVNENV